MVGRRMVRRMDGWMDGWMNYVKEISLFILTSLFAEINLHLSFLFAAASSLERVMQVFRVCN